MIQDQMIEPAAAAAAREMQAALLAGDRLSDVAQASPMLVSIAISLKRIADGVAVLVDQSREKVDG